MGLTADGRRLTAGLTAAVCLALALLAGPGPAAAQAPATQAPPGTLVVLNKGAGTASLVAMPEGRVVATLPAGTAPHEVVLSPDGRYAVVSDYGTAQQPGNALVVLDLAAGRVLRTVPLGPYHRPHGLAWSADGFRLAVTAEAERMLLVVDSRRWEVVRAIPTDQQTSHMVALAPDGARAFVANISGGSVSVLDLRGGTRAAIVPTALGTEGVAVAPGGREVWATNRSANTISVLDARTLSTLATIPSADFPIRVRFTPDGRRALVSHARSSELRVFDVARRTVVGTVVLPLDTARAEPTLLGAQFARSAVPIGIAVAPDGGTAWVATSATGQVAEVDLTTLRVRRYLEVGREPDGVAFSPRRPPP